MITHAVFVDKDGKVITHWQDCLEPMTGDHLMGKDGNDVYQIIDKDYHRIDDNTMGVTITVKKLV